MSVSDSHFKKNNNQGTNGGFGRPAVLFVASEHVANGVAQREVWLKIRAVEHIANTVQVASRENSVLGAAAQMHLHHLFATKKQGVWRAG